MSAVTIQQIAALRLRHSRTAFIAAYEAMPDDKQNWKPAISDVSGRSARNLFEECILTNTTFAEMLRSGIEPDFDWAAAHARFIDMDSVALVEEFRTGNEALEAAISSLTDDQLERRFVWPWAEREVSFAEFAFIPAWHLDYHAGQINYIQVLYGDSEDHAAPA